MVIGKDLEAFYRTANYTLVNQCDMLPEMREEAVDICAIAIEKHQADLEKATQVRKCLALLFIKERPLLRQPKR